MDFMSQKQKIAFRKARREALVWCVAKGMMTDEEMFFALNYGEKYPRRDQTTAIIRMKEYLDIHPDERNLLVAQILYNGCQHPMTNDAPKWAKELATKPRHTGL